jgi:hypothetical protein
LAEAQVTSTAEQDQQAVFDLVALGFERASEATGLLTREFLVAGLRLRLRFAGPALMPVIVPALAHLEVEAAGEPDFTIDLFDAASTGTPLPFLAARFVELTRLRWWEVLQGRREIKGLNGADIQAVFHLGPDILVLRDAPRRRGLYWVEQAESIPYYEKGYPLSVLLNWWLGSRQRLMVHAASIGGAAGGVLLTGRGGSGKSTTTLACMTAGLTIAGDDYAAIELGSGVVHSLYNTVKLKTRADVDRFPGLAERVSNLDRIGEEDDAEKAMVFLHEHYPERLVPSLPVRAILVPRIVDAVETVIVPAPAAAAFKALAPSTLFQLPGNAHATFRALAQVVRDIPSYEIQLGRDIGAIPGVISRFLDDGCNASRAA